MAFITGNQHTDFLSFTKQAIYTPFATDGIVGKVNINALLLRLFCIKNGPMHAVMERERNVR